MHTPYARDCSQGLLKTNISNLIVAPFAWASFAKTSLKLLLVLKNDLYVFNVLQFMVKSK